MAKKMRGDTEFEDDVTGETGQPNGKKRVKRGRTNGYDADAVRRYADRLHNLHDEMESEAGRYRADIKALLDEIADAGIPKKTFKLVFGEERRARKLKAKLEALDIDERSSFDMLKDALGAFGDTPLGTAALQQAEASGAPAGNA